jgi:hypothetical protein
MTGAVLVAIPLLLIAAAYHVIALLFCHGSRERDDDQETGDDHDED